MPRKRREPAVPRQAMLMGGLGCPVPECGGMREPRSDGNGYVRDVCDRCTARVHEVRLLRRHIARLTGHEPPPIPLRPTGPVPATAATTAAPTAPPTELPAEPSSGEGRGTRPRTTTVAILDALERGERPMRIDEIYPLVIQRRPTTTRASVSQLLYQLVQRGEIVATDRDHSRIGAPKRYALPPRADREAAP